MAKEKFIDIVKRLQDENQGKIILIRCGIFFCGIGKDAVILNELIDYKPICAQKGICKVGIPVNCFRQVIPKLVETDYTYIVYDYDKKEKKVMEIYRIEGSEIYEEKENIGCDKCWYNANKQKLRKIERSRYIDRIVHRWYVDNFIQEYFAKQFIANSYACIKNRGTHKACLDVQKGMKHCQKIWKEYYILKMDATKFFQNIDKNILMKILKRKIKDKDLLWLTKEIVYSSEGNKSLPIGNYTSQIFANIYLNEVDQYIKHVLKIKFYYRFMDDSIILVKTKEEAKEALEKIRKFLKENLELELNNKTQIFKNKQGVNFCRVQGKRI